jgi:hypothetical protein
MAITAIPIQPVESISGNQFRAFRTIEEATQTFKVGTIVSLAADGGLQAWNGTTYGTAFTGGTQGSPVGVSYEAASNLSSTGKGAPVPFSPITGLGSAITFGSVPNETAAVNIPHGAPINDGRCGYILPAADVIFSATFGNAGSPATPAVTNVGVVYGMTIDSGGNFWYVDISKATAGTNTLVKIVGLDPRDVPGSGTRVLIQFLQYAVQLLG